MLWTLFLCNSGRRVSGGIGAGRSCATIDAVRRRSVWTAIRLTGTQRRAFVVAKRHNLHMYAHTSGFSVFVFWFIIRADYVLRRRGYCDHFVTMYGMVWYGMVWYGMVWYGMV